MLQVLDVGDFSVQCWTLLSLASNVPILLLCFCKCEGALLFEDSDRRGPEGERGIHKWSNAEEGKIKEKKGVATESIQSGDEENRGDA